MSRAYRITVKESETRTIKGSDEIGTRLELLEILPPEATAELLRQELKTRGFEERDDGTLARDDGDVTVVVDPCSGEVTVRSEVAEDVSLEAKRDVVGYDDAGPNPASARERAKEQLKADLEKKAEKETARLQGQATEALERKLEEVRPELSEVVNKVTREALKQKAAQLGSVKEVHEDAETGNMTIKIEV